MTLQNLFKFSWCWLRRFFWLALLLWGLGSSGLPFRDFKDQLRGITSTVEFDYGSWIMDALNVKVGQFSTGASHYLAGDQRSNLVREYFATVHEMHRLEYELERIISDPALSDPQHASIPIRQALQETQHQHANLQPMAESILQEQVAVVLADLGLAIAGMPVPPLAFHFSDTPNALVVSPRSIIRQDANIDLIAEFDLDERIAIEETIDKQLDVSTLVVRTGGIGVYPTMVLDSSSQGWIVETIVHEWVHNYLTWHPLGLNYNTSADLRTINETVATIMGKEIGRLVLLRYYPELVPADMPAVTNSESSPVTEDVFDFHAAMRETRVTVDDFLAHGQIEIAEEYMRARRIVFWEQGYMIRKLNQAYFAFHGAYAAHPGGGAAGADPVGAAVRELWESIHDPGKFLKTVAWINDPDDLFRLVAAESQ